MNCDPNALAQAAQCFCSPIAILDNAATYLLCQWANLAACSPPIVSNLAEIDSDDACIFLHFDSTRDPSLYFLVYYGTTSGGPYNAPGSPVQLGANQRDIGLCVPQINVLTTYFVVVVAVDSLSCQSSPSNQASGSTV